MWRNPTTWLLGCCITLAATPVSAEAPVFATWGDAEGLTSAENLPYPGYDERVPVWWDVTLDNDPDLLYFSGATIRRLYRPSGQDLQWALVEVADSQPHVQASVSVTVDVDGDGIDELLVLGHRAALYRVVEPDLIEETPVPLPLLHAMSANDASVGDINRDGLPDIFVAMGHGSPERFNFVGRPDVILMNRGSGRLEAIELGRFEAIGLTPRGGLNNGITLADIDGDGRLDAVESVDKSGIAGRSRLLLNRTQPGDTVPSFEPSEHRWDVGTAGMGLDVADVDGDGHLDMYNTSSGHDLLVMGLGEGRFRDETYDRGILHEWTSLGPRMQWSPSFVDLDLDGRLDILVRHGLPWSWVPNFASSWAADVLYVQQDDGTFDRVATPGEHGTGDGMRFAVGDVDGDGRPDAARDGMAHSVVFWHNVTPIEPSTRVLTVRFAATVSGSPPTGTIVVGTCGATTHTRLIRSGGKMGATPAVEAHLAWSECTDESVHIEVRWPSGAVTTGEIPSGVTRWLADEPRWFSEGEGNAVVLDPTGTGADQACMEAEDGSWACCDTRCEQSRPATGAAIVRLDDHAAMSLPPRETSWLLVTNPHLPRPGATATIHVLHVGAQETFPGDTASLTLDGVPVPWGDVDEATRSMSAMVSVEEDATSLALALRVDDVEVASWNPSVGLIFDSANAWYDVYPVRTTLGWLADEPWVVGIYTAAGVFDPSLISQLKLSTPGGADIPIIDAVVQEGFRRSTLRVSWSDLAGVDTVMVQDHPLGASLALPVWQPSSVEAQLATVGSVQCGLSRTRINPGSGISNGILTVFDQEGHPMLIPPSELDLEVQGGTLDGSVRLQAGIQDMFFDIVAGDEPGPGQVIVRSQEGDEWGRCEFDVIEWPTQAHDQTQSWATLSRTELYASAVNQTTRLRIGVVNAFGELLGTDVWPEVLLTGGEWTTPLRLVPDAGTLYGDIGPSPGSEEITITVTLEGQVLDTFTVTITGQTSTGVDPPEPTDPGDGGCSSTGTSPAWTALLFGWLALRTRRRRALVSNVSSRRPAE